ncbi:SDR family NAD(P)-dependent oxidoreductase [Marinivivus vitaminiproducens]|uniref:SDR family NAD(P)-dependent oxidoreductase n=1 Tax=Marinivivus vitaminiproducens TaxID=3035935 RepID=UPI00279F44C4|nr:SDR family NAD(P)-dependent oxidoreductase [Geminicoccaceae bacterium SCSIO 64248]
MPDIDRRSVLSTAALAAPALGLGIDQAAAQTSEGGAKPLAGKVALVTGAARGIGLASAVQLARQGAAVALVDIADPQAIPAISDYPLASPGDLSAAEEAIRAEGVDVLTMAADVRDAAAMAQAVEDVTTGLGGIDIVVTAAGVNVTDDTVDSFDQARWDAIMSVNVTGSLTTVLAALPALRERPGARVVLISSREGRVGTGSLIYSTSKWAVTGLMKNLALELGPQGITVNAVAPAGVDTVLFHRSSGGQPNEEQRAQMEDRSRASSVLPVGVLEPQAVGEAVAFLAGPGSAFISGSTIDVQAGRTALSLG